MKYFCFCQGDVLLTKEQDIPLDVSSLGLRPWNFVTKFCWNVPAGQGGEGGSSAQVAIEECQVVRLDNPVVTDDFKMMPLRQSYDVLPAIDYQLAGKCAELLYWDQNSKYCGCCGAPMKWQTEISKQCTNCGKELWPQLQTAIIVRITRSPQGLSVDGAREQEEILMVHGRNFRRSYYGLVAGFVETGETLEESVRREVREEVGLEIEDIRYFGSQPWPYPCGLMVGFTARYVSGELKLQKSEISDGGWFKRGAMPEYPGPVSIAGQLIRDWLQQ